MICIDPDKCTRCGACVRDCIVEVLKPGADGVPALAPELEKYCLNCQHCLAVCPAGAVTCHGVGPADCPAAGPLPESAQMLNLLRQRRSVRQYRDENVSPEVLSSLRDALAWTPTGCNAHSLVFRMVEDKSEMAFFRTEMTRMLQTLIRTGILHLVYPNFKRYLGEIMAGKDVIFRNAPHMIVAAAPKNAPCREADPWIALSYLDLYMQTLGLGSCWCGFAVHAFKWNRKLRAKLGFPRDCRVGAVLLFGKPAVTYVRPTRPAPFRFTGK